MRKLFIGNLNVNVTLDDIDELFGLKTTKYPRSNSYVEMPLNRNGQTRGFAFVTAPDHVRNELLKLNNIQFRENNYGSSQNENENSKNNSEIEPLYQDTSSCEPFSRALRCVQWI